MKVATPNKKQFIRKFNFNEKTFQKIKIMPGEKGTLFLSTLISFDLEMYYSWSGIPNRIKQKLSLNFIFLV